MFCRKPLKPHWVQGRAAVTGDKVIKFAYHHGEKLRMDTSEKKMEPGSQCWLDNTRRVRVIRPLNRSQTMFAVETPEREILTVERSRLSPINATPSPSPEKSP